MPRRLGWRHAALHQHERGAQLFLIERGTAGFAAFAACGVHAVAGAFGDEAAFELGNRAEDVEHQLAGGRRRIDFLFEREKRDPAFLERFDDLPYLVRCRPMPLEATCACVRLRACPWG